ncbi:MAG: M23 family metallopeptidase [Clostridiales bacterium]|nr:M23 family metallopeptidase [Clostridiales bacterium]
MIKCKQNVKIVNGKLKEKEVFIISQDNISKISILKITTKIFTIIITMLILIIALMLLIYKPAYKVTLANNTIGYIDNEEKFNKELTNYLEQSNDKIAYVHIDEQPKTEFMFVKKNTDIDEKNVLEIVKANTIIYNRVYTINTSDEEIAVVETKSEAEELLQEIKDSINNDNVEITINEAHLVNPIFTEDKEFVVATMESKYKTRTIAQYGVGGLSVKKEIVPQSINVAFASPARGTITSRFGYRSSGFHTGIDIANPVGTPIYAAADGVVIKAETIGNYGRTIVIQHADNMITYYAHCNELLVNVGDEITQGTQVATIGMTGRTTGPHVHFEVRIDNKCVDPTSYIENIGK